MNCKGYLYLCLAFSMVCSAQVDRAVLTGTIQDPSAAAIVNATVELKSAGTGLERSTQSGEDGGYRFPGLPIGEYTLTVQNVGFKTYTLSGIQLQVGQTRTANVSLQIASQDTSVTVVDTAPVFDVTSAQISSVITSAEISKLPVNGRDWSSFMLLAPGAVDSGGGTLRSIRFTGRTKDDNNFVFDGVDASGVKEGPHLTALRTVISNDAIAEFKVNALMATAETGNAIGAVVSLVSKTGTNQFHGGAFEYLRNSALDARRFFDARKPDLRMNQFGGNVGGPVVKNKLFFFTNFEAVRQSLGRTFIGFVPSDSLRTRVKAASPALASVMDAYPVGAPVLRSNGTIDPDSARASVVGKQAWSENSGMFRVDYHISEKDTMYVRYNIADGIIEDPQSIFLNTLSNKLAAHNAVVQHQRVISPTLVNEFKLGFNRSGNSRVRLSKSRDTIAIANLETLPGTWTERDPGNSYSLIDNLSWIHGAHSVKFGFEMRHIQVNISQEQRNDLAYASFADLIANRLNTYNFTGEFASRGVRTENYYAYIQDEWRVRSNLTMNLGLRYEYYTPEYEVAGRTRQYAVGLCPGDICIGKQGPGLYSPDFNNFGPRLSFAWSPTALKGKTTIRTGAGIYYQQGQLDDLLGPIESDNRRFGLTAVDTPGLKYPIDGFINAGSGQPDTPRALGYDHRDFINYQATFLVAQELPGQFSLQTGYTMSLARHLLQRTAANPFFPGTSVRPSPAFGLIDIKWSGGVANFHGWQTSLNRRFRNGFLTGVQYQWGKAIDDGSGGSNEASYPQDLNCRACERARGNFDVRHNFSLNYAYELPFGRGKSMLANGIGDWVAGGWQLSGILTARTGRPVNILINRAVSAATDGYNGIFSTTQRPNYTGGSLIPTNQSVNNWIDPSGLSIPANLTRGNLGRNVLSGPGLFQIDLGMTKRVPLGERSAIIFRAEAFNIANKANFAQPGATFAVPTPSAFGRITSVLNSGATGSGGARSMQFMMRLEF